MVAGAVAAIAIDLAMLVILGPLGLFHWLPLLLITVALTLAGRRGAAVLLARRAARAPPRLGRLAAGRAGLDGAGAAPARLAPGAVRGRAAQPRGARGAPAHVRQLGDAGRRRPSPIYGPSRIFLGYVAPLGVTAILSGQDAGHGGGRVRAAADDPVRGRRTAAWRGRSAASARHAAWARRATSTSPWTTRTPPPRPTGCCSRCRSRSRSCACRTRARRCSRSCPRRWRWSSSMDASRWGGRSRPGMLAVTIGVGILVHPAIGAFTAGTVAVIGLVSASRTRAAFAGIAGGLLIASPALLVAAGRRGDAAHRGAAGAGGRAAGGDAGRSGGPRRLVDAPAARARRCASGRSCWACRRAHGARRPGAADRHPALLAG